MTPSERTPEFLLFSNGSSIYAWTADNLGENASFPASGGVPMGSFGNLSELFALGGNPWSEFYPLVNLKTELKRAPIVSYRAESDDHEFIINLGMHLHTIQGLLERDSNDSLWFVIMRDQTVIGATGTDQPFDSANDLIILKTIDQLADPWRMVLQDRQSKNLTESVKYASTFKNSMELFAGVRPIPIPGSWDKEWYLWMATVHEPLLDGELGVNAASLLVFFATLTVVLAIFEILIIASGRLTDRQRGKNLATPRESNHVKRVGLDEAMFLLRQLGLSYPDNSDVQSSVHEIAQSVTAGIPDLLYKKSFIYRSISNPHVKERIELIFGNQPVRIIPTNTFQTVSIKDITTRKFLTQEDVRTDDLVEMIVSGQSLFVADSFRGIVSDLIGMVPDRYLPLLHDSLDWNRFFLRKAMIRPSESTLALMLGTLMFHVVMDDRASQKLIARFYLLNNETFRSRIRDLKRALFPFVVEVSDRWNRFLRALNILIDHSPISAQASCLSSHNAEESDQIGADHLIALLFVTSMISYMFQLDGWSRAHPLITSDFGAADVDALIKCLVQSVVKSAIEALAIVYQIADLRESKFLARLSLWSWSAPAPAT
jgi:hypothetical protein